MAKVSDAFRRHHHQRLQETAPHAAVLTDGNADGEPEPFVHFLRHELLPHAAGEERTVYPAVEPLLKAHGMATATMRIDHRAIERFIEVRHGRPFALQIPADRVLAAAAPGMAIALVVLSFNLVGDGPA